MKTETDPGVAETLLYHEQTKHHFHRYARSTGFLDWANQPNPFRFYEGVTAVRLPLQHEDPPAGHQALYERSRNVFQSFSRETIGAFLELSLGLSAWKSIPGNSWALRMNPSSGNLHPTEAYLIVPAVRGITAGVFHYNPYLHALEPRAALPESLSQRITEHLHADGFLVALTSIFWREAWKYGERAFRYCQHDVGHALAALSFSANLLGWQVTGLNAVSDEEIARLLGFDQTHWPELEVEHPELLCFVHCCGELRIPEDLPHETATEFSKLKFQGTPNRLSEDHVDWEIIGRVAEATARRKSRKEPLARAASSSASSPCEAHAGRGLRRDHPELLSRIAPMNREKIRMLIINELESGSWAGEINKDGPPHPDPLLHPMEVREESKSSMAPRPLAALVCHGLADTTRPVYPAMVQSGISAAQIIRQRRSAVEFDGTTGITKDQFFMMLDKTLPRGGFAPFDLGLSVPCVHLLLFVHRVPGLEPGLYFLLRTERDLRALQQRCHRHFLWRPVDEAMPEQAGLPLYLLKAGDFQSTATSVSCQQSIAGDGAFSLGMIARFREEIEAAPYRYRHLFWETGMIGQVLYLEAEAQGVRATGIGCFFDDPVHEVMGLSDDAFQSLYHFTVGGPLEDARLATRAAYHHLESRAALSP